MESDDERLERLYKICAAFDRPVYFDAGLSWEPNCLLRYSSPLNLEAAILAHPELNFALAHFGWPFVREMVALLLKYPNVYTDTSVMYLGSPEDSQRKLFTLDMEVLDFERSFRDRVMFASNTPRFRGFKIKRALESLPFSERALEAIFHLNAEQYMKGAI